MFKNHRIQRSKSVRFISKCKEKLKRICVKNCFTTENLISFRIILFYHVHLYYQTFDDFFHQLPMLFRTKLIKRRKMSTVPFSHIENQSALKYALYGIIALRCTLKKVLFSLNRCIISCSFRFNIAT